MFFTDLLNIVGHVIVRLYTDDIFWKRARIIVCSYHIQYVAFLVNSDTHSLAVDILHRAHDKMHIHQANEKEQPVRSKSPWPRLSVVKF